MIGKLRYQDTFNWKSARNVSANLRNLQHSWYTMKTNSGLVRKQKNFLIKIHLMCYSKILNSSIEIMAWIWDGMNKLKKLLFVRKKASEHIAATNEKILWSFHAVRKLRIEGLRKSQVEDALKNCVLVEDYTWQDVRCRIAWFLDLLIESLFMFS